MDLLQLIYHSRPFGYDQSILNGILVDARRCNRRDGITGALICRQDCFLQLLEGPEAMVRGTFARILRDDRHVEVVRVSDRPVSARLFGDWDMLHDPARSWLWSLQEVADGALERTSAAEVTAIFHGLRDRMATAGDR